MDEPDERREFRDLFARRWRALLRWLALLVVGIAVVVVLVSVGGDDGFGQIEADNPTRSYFLVFFLVAADAVIPIFPGETTLNAASTSRPTAISSSGS
jgi:membrane-associated protein